MVKEGGRGPAARGPPLPTVPLLLRRLSVAADIAGGRSGGIEEEEG
jgi:hypothetical protein